MVRALTSLLPLALTGIFEVVNRLYGVTIKPTDELPSWHEDVRCYRVLDSDGLDLGSFYADLHPRENKRDALQ